MAEQGDSRCRSRPCGNGGIHRARLRSRRFRLINAPLDMKGPDCVPAGSQRMVFGVAGMSLSLPERIRCRYYVGNYLAGLERILRNEPRITLLVNNAGVGATLPLLASNVEDMSR